MNVSNILTRNYKNFIPLAGQKNKPNSNPIKANLRKAKMNINSLITKDYRKKDAFAVQKNKPNFVKGPKLAQTHFSQRIMKMNHLPSPKKQTQNKPNFFKGQNELKIACQKIWSHPMISKPNFRPNFSLIKVELL
jgi:hypothetical protein